MKKIILIIGILCLIIVGIIWIYNKNDNKQENYQPQNMSNTQSVENKTETIQNPGNMRAEVYQKKRKNKK